MLSTGDNSDPEAISLNQQVKYAAGKAETISGISTPNASTIVFHLTQPMGDFLYQLTSPEAASHLLPLKSDCYGGLAFLRRV